MKKIIKYFIVLFIILLSSCTSTNNDTKEEYVNVYLEESENYEILSANPVKITKGSNARFEVKIPDDQIYDYSDHGYYDERKSLFIVPNVQMSQTVNFYTRIKGGCNLTIVNDSVLGEYTVTPNRRNFVAGETVTIKTTPININEFMCYSYNNPYRANSYGQASGMALGFEEEYTFTITKDTTIHINYLSNKLLKMEYVANGGTTIDNKDSFVVDYKISDIHLYPSTILGTYYLFRDGYTLESYNTKADGSGTRVGIGAKVDAKFIKDNKITLYAQWEKWTDADKFQFGELNNDLALIKYTGDPNVDKIVVPNEVDGKKVVQINGQAFNNVNMNTLILNQDLKTIGHKAVIDCPELKNLLMFTEIETVTKESFTNTGLTTVNINSTVYSNNNTLNIRDVSAQIEQIKEMKNDRVIFVGQTPIRYNHDLTPFKEKYPNKDFYTYGMQEGANYAIPLDILSKFLTENDKVVFAIQENAMNPNYVGSFTFTYLKYNFDLLALLNYQTYINCFFSSYMQFIKYMSRGLYNDVFNAENGLKLDAFGNIVSGKATENIDNVDASYKPNLDSYQKAEYYTYVNDIIDNSELTYDNFYITWNTYNLNSVKDFSLFDNFENYVRSVLPNVQYLDTIRDNIYPGDYFIEKSSVKLSTTGGKARVARWLEIFSI